MKYTLAVLFLAVYAFSGCNPKNKAEEKVASPKIEDSFAVTSTQNLVGVTSDKSRVIIKKAAFDKEFLLASGYIEQLPGPQFQALESMIVSFIQRDGKIFMLNVTGTQQVGAKQSREPLILAEFKILVEESAHVEIDFNAGMSRLLMGSKELMADEMHQDYGILSLAVRSSYLEQVIFEKESLLIRQMAVLNDNKTDVAVEIRYQLKPYLPDSSFRKAVYTEDPRIAFFTTGAIFSEEGWDEKYISKFNEKKKIQFAISANTPEEFRPLVREGILYWNRVLGEGKIEVTQLEDKSTKAPHFDLNIVQWVDWDTLSSAYADWHTDPRTGEVLSGNVFLSSGMFHSVQSSAKREIALRVGLKGFRKTSLCRKNILREGAETVAQDNSNEVSKHIGKNSFVATVAHEIGHLLGLRHNFAGSLSATYDYKDRQAILDKYYKNLNPPDDLYVASTVMDYLPIQDEAMQVDNFRKTPNQALSYDKMAIEHLYSETPLPEESRPVFCTDDDVGVYADCRRHDSGRSVVSFFSGAYQAEVGKIPALLMRRYVPSADAPAANLAKITFNVNSHAALMSDHFSGVLSLLKSPRLLAVEAKYQPVTSLNRDRIKEETQKFVEAEFARLGGSTVLLNAVPEKFKETAMADFIALSEQKPKFAEHYSKPEVRQQIEAQVRETLNQYEEALIKSEIGGFASKDSEEQWADSALSRELAAIISGLFDKYAISKKDGTAPKEISYIDGVKKQVNVPVYLYQDSVREAALGMFLGKAQAIEWAAVEKAAAKTMLKKELEILGEPDKIDISKLDSETLRWMLMNQRLLKKLD